MKAQPYCPDKPTLVHHHHPGSGNFMRRMGHTRAGGVTGAGDLAAASPQPRGQPSTPLPASASRAAA